MVVWDTEDASDGGWVAHTYPDVSFAAEIGGWVEGFTFCEDGSDGVEGLFVESLAGLVQVVNHHAIQFAV